MPLSGISEMLFTKKASKNKTDKIKEIGNMP